VSGAQRALDSLPERLLKLIAGLDVASFGDSLDILHEAKCHRDAEVRLEEQLFETFQRSGLDAPHGDADVHERDVFDALPE
jgi:hypothetical protein